MKLKLKSTALLLLVTILSFGQIVKNQEWEFTNTVTLSGDVVIPSGASNGDVLTSDGSGNATWQASGSGVVRSETVTISSAQILAWHTTPITIVAAQGANTTIVPIHATITYTYGTSSYLGDTGIEFYLGGSWSVYSGALSLPNSVVYYKSLLVNAGVQGGSTTNQPLLVTSQSSNPISGDGTLKITVLYYTVNL